MEQTAAVEKYAVAADLRTRRGAAEALWQRHHRDDREAVQKDEISRCDHYFDRVTDQTAPAAFYRIASVRESGRELRPLASFASGVDEFWQGLEKTGGPQALTTAVSQTRDFLDQHVSARGGRGDPRLRRGISS